MDGWPDGWTEESEPEGARVMPHVQRRQGGYAPSQPQSQPYYSAPGSQASGAEPPLPPGLSPRRAAARGGVPQQADGDGGGTYRAGRARAGRPKNWRKRITYGVLTLAVVLLATSVGTYFWADSKLARTVDLGALPNRPALGKGTNYLIAGSDNRGNLTHQQQQDLHVGSDNEGQFGNSDTMMILHVGSNGDTMLSLPRDSYVTIPAFTGSTGKHYPASKHKLNVSFSWGGGALLAQTVEYNTGIHIDHYAEIGFGGFVNLVDSLGGVNLCLDKAIKDQASGADLKAGCQTLNGKQSLAFVRERHQEANQDLGREKHQQQFLHAVADQTAAPSTLLNPFKLYPVLGAGLETLKVDQGMSLYDLAQMGLAMKDVSGGQGTSTVVPIANPDLHTADGSSVLWNQTEAKILFGKLQNDERVGG
ncbi:LCP family protein [Streptantibioticus ferralitis]|uniref:LCP family protein n=1 Tax=Streptantibioticus ferralitis TaxID=236510 RepID=A0ABT5Z974_9ACTN|nr:LCP family protein [Streptantibioticus ferralitis]MDF2260384.1 LCP family protein [Streptantibioticus ferralitis]